MGIVLNDLETQRFGITCAKLADDYPDLKSVNEMARAQNVSMLSTRVSVDDFSRIHDLESDGYQLMDTLVYYGCNLYSRFRQNSLDERLDQKLTKAGLELHRATAEDEENVGVVAKKAFTDYFGHYHSDPRLDNQAADEVYMQWAQTSVRHTNEQSPVLIMTKENDLAGFITLRLNSKTEGEACLSGISPAYRAKGIYSFLIASSMKTLKEAGAQKMIVSTQLNNYVVQKVWTRQGFSLERAFYTFHKWMR